MSKMQQENQRKNCPSCGAPIVSEICAYCGAATGLNTSMADMEYPILECKAVVMNFWTIWFPMIFAGAFGIPGLILLIITTTVYKNMILLLLGIPFFIIGFISSTLIFRMCFRYLKVKKRGKIIQATVYGYMNDNVILNGQPSQIAKLLVHTPDGPRFILYKLRNTLKLYKINDKIDIVVYKNHFMICNNKEVIRW